MVHEAAYHADSLFITLTYDDESLPDNDDLEKEELQRFFKRVRKRLGARRIKYYACGEYGERYGRPHYHAAIFGLAPCGRCPSCNRGERGGGAPRESEGDCEVLVSSWPHGFVHVDSLNAASARYIAGYIEKALFTPALMGRARPFSLMSKGLGKRYALENFERLMIHGGDTVMGKPVGLPKYYQKILGVPTANLQRWSEERKAEIASWYEEKYGDGDLNGERQWKAVQAHRQQTERNLKGKGALRERDYEA